MGYWLWSEERQGHPGRWRVAETAGPGVDEAGAPGAGCPWTPAVFLSVSASSSEQPPGGVGFSCRGRLHVSTLRGGSGGSAERMTPDLEENCSEVQGGPRLSPACPCAAPRNPQPRQPSSVSQRFPEPRRSARGRPQQPGRRAGAQRRGPSSKLSGPDASHLRTRCPRGRQ